QLLGVQGFVDTVEITIGRRQRLRRCHGFLVRGGFRRPDGLHCTRHGYSSSCQDLSSSRAGCRHYPFPTDSTCVPPAAGALFQAAFLADADTLSALARSSRRPSSTSSRSASSSAMVRDPTSAWTLSMSFFC